MVQETSFFSSNHSASADANRSPDRETRQIKKLPDKVILHGAPSKGWTGLGYIGAREPKFMLLRTPGERHRDCVNPTKIWATRPYEYQKPHLLLSIVGLGRRHEIFNPFTARDSHTLNRHRFHMENEYEAEIAHPGGEGVRPMIIDTVSLRDVIIFQRKLISIFFLSRDELGRIFGLRVRNYWPG